MKKTKRTVMIIFIIILILLALLIADSRWKLVTDSYSVSSERLPESFDGFRIVQLSDLHGMEFGSGSSRLVSAVGAQEPDIIVLTGDIADENTDMDVIDTLLEKLTAIAPVYYVSGNHEWAAGKITQMAELLEEHGAVYLRNEYCLLERDGESIVLAGVEDPNGNKDMTTPDELVDIIKEEQGDAFTVLLGHRNYWAEKYPDLEVDIIMCGHAHGGIVRLPLLGGVIGAGFKLFPDYVSGQYSCGSYELIVSRGLGNSVPIPRFLNNPEVVSLTLSTGS